MNHIYKVVYSVAHAAYVVASEFAKSKTKSTSTSTSTFTSTSIKALTLLTLAASINIALMSDAYASCWNQPNYITGGAVNSSDYCGDVLIGYQAQGLRSPYSWPEFNALLGARTQSTGEQITIVGYKSRAYTESTVLGAGSTIDFTRSVAIGASSYVKGNHGIAIGYGSRVTQTRDNYDQYSAAIGNGAEVEDVRWSVALGSESKVYKTDMNASDKNDKVVSVGDSKNASKNKRIINLREGTLDTDAISLKQLKARNLALVGIGLPTNNDNVTAGAVYNNFLKKDGSNLLDAPDEKKKFGARVGEAFNINTTQEAETTLVQAGSLAQQFKSIDSNLTTLRDNIDKKASLDVFNELNNKFQVGLTFKDANNQTLSKGLGGTVKIEGNKHITVIADTASNAFKLRLADSLTGLTSVNTDSLKATGNVDAGKVTVGKLVISKDKITGLAENTDSENGAVNLGQVNKKITEVTTQLNNILLKDGSNISTEAEAKKKLGENVGVVLGTDEADKSLVQAGSVATKFKTLNQTIDGMSTDLGTGLVFSDGTVTVDRNLGQDVTIKGANDNLAVNLSQEGVFTVSLGKSLTNLDSVGADSVTVDGKLTAGSVNVGNVKINDQNKNKITGLANAAAEKDALTYGQLQEKSTEVQSEIDKITGTGNTDGLLKNYLRKEGGNVTAKAEFGRHVGVAVSKQTDASETSLAQAGSVAGEFSGIKNRLQPLETNMAKGLNFSDGKGAAVKKDLGASVAIKGADNNLTVKVDGQNLVVALEKTLTDLTSVSATELTDGTVAIRGDKITGLAENTNDDKGAVNLAQVNQKVTEVTTQSGNFLNRDGSNIKGDTVAQKNLGANVGVRIEAGTKVNDTSLVQAGSVAEGLKAVQSQINAITGHDGPTQGGQAFDGLKLAGDSPEVLKRQLNQTINFQGGEAIANKLTTDKNLGVVVENDALAIRLAKNLKGLETITANNISAGSVDVGNVKINDQNNNKITGLVNGTRDKDALTYGQFKQGLSTLENKIGEITGTGQGGLTNNYLKVSGENIQTDEDRQKLGKNVGIKIAADTRTDDTTLVQAGSVAEGFNQIGSRLNDLTTGMNGKASSSEVQNLADQVNAGLSFSDGNSLPVKKALGSTVKIQGANNVTVANNNGNFTVALGKSLTNLESVSADLLTDGTIEITQGTIRQLKDATSDKEAINFGQLNREIARVTAKSGDYLKGDGDNIKGDAVAQKKLGANVGVKMKAGTTKSDDTSLVQAGSVAEGFKSVQKQINAITGYDGSTQGGQGQQAFGGLTIAGDSPTETFNHKLSGQLQFHGGEQDTNNLTVEKNFGVVADARKGQEGLEIRLAKNLKGLETVSVEKKITAGSMQAGNVTIMNNKLTGLGDAEYSSDAINYGQFKQNFDKLREEIGKITGTGGTGGTGQNQDSLLGNLLDKKGKNIKTVADRQKFGGNVGIRIEAGTQTDETSLLQAGSVAEGFGRVNTELKDLKDKLGQKAASNLVTALSNKVNNGLNFSDGKNHITQAGLGDTVYIQGENDNLTVTADEKGDFTIALGESLDNLNSVNARIFTDGKVTISGGRITGLKDAEFEDEAINVKQLNSKFTEINNQLNSKLKKDGRNISTADKQTLGSNVGVAVSAQIGVDDTSLVQAGSVAEGFKSIQSQINAITGQTGPTPPTPGAGNKPQALELKLAGDDKKLLKRKLTQKITFKGGEENVDSLTSSAEQNLGVVVDTKKGHEGLEIRLAKNLNGLRDITAAGKVTAGSMEIGGFSGIEINQNKITGLADGTANSDAINYSQFKQGVDTLGNKINEITGTDQNTGSLLSNLLEKNGGNIQNDAEKQEFGSNVGVALTDNHSTSDTSLVQAGSVAQEFSRVDEKLNNLTAEIALKADKTASTNLSTELRKGFKVNDGKSSSSKRLGDTVMIKAADNNLTVEANVPEKSFTIKLGKSLDRLTSVTAKTLTDGKVEIRDSEIIGLTAATQANQAINLEQLTGKITETTGQFTNYLEKSGNNIVHGIDAQKKLGANVGVAIKAGTQVGDTSLVQAGSVAEGFKSIQEQINAITGQNGPNIDGQGQVQPLTLKLVGDGTQELTRKLSDTIKFKGGEKDTNNLTTRADKNIGVFVKDEAVEIRLAKNLKGLNNITATGLVTAGDVKAGTVIIDQGKITNLAKANKNDEAINYEQFQDGYKELKAGLDKITGGTGQNTGNSLEDRYLTKSGNNVTSQKDFGKNVGVGISDKTPASETSLAQAGVVAQKFSQVGTGLDNLTKVVESKANLQDLNEIKEQLTKGLIFSDGNTDFSRKLGQFVSIKGNYDNLVVKANTTAGKEGFAIALGKSIDSLDSVQATTLSASGNVAISDGQITGLKDAENNNEVVNLRKLNQEFTGVNNKLGNFLSKDGSNIKGDVVAQKKFGANVGVEVKAGTKFEDTSLVQANSVAKGFKSIQEQINAITGQNGPIPDGQMRPLSLKLESDSQTPLNIELAKKMPLQLKGGEQDENQLTGLTDSNIGIVADAKKEGLEVHLAKNLKGLESITATGKIAAGSMQVGKIGINVDQANTGKITGLVKAVKNDEAINLAQLQEGYNNLQSEIEKITGSGTGQNPGLLSSYLKKDGSNIKTEAEKKTFGGNVGVAVSAQTGADDTSLAQVGSVAQGFSQVTTKLEGLTTQVANKVDRTQFDTLQATVNKGLTFSDGKPASDYKAELGGKVTIKGADNDANLTVTNQNGTFTVALGKTLTGLTSVQAGTITADTLSDGTVSIGNGKITGLADGQAKGEAVNYGQLETAYNTINTRIEGITGQGGILNERYLRRDGSNIKTEADRKKLGGNVGVELTKEEDTSLVQAGSVAKGFKHMQGKIDHIKQTSIFDFTGDIDTSTTVYANQVNAKANTMTLTGGETDPNMLTTLTDKNFGVIKNGNKLEFRLAKNLSGLDSITMGGMKLTGTGGAQGINMGTLTVSNLGNAATDDQVVNLLQVKDLARRLYDEFTNPNGGTGHLSGYLRVDGNNVIDKAKFGANVGTSQIKAGSTELAQAGAVHSAIKDATSVRIDVKNEADTSKNLLDKTADLNTNLASLADQINKNSMAAKNDADSVANMVKEVTTQAEKLEGNVSKLASHIDNMDDRLQAGIASSTAIGMLQSPIRVGGSSISAAVGGYRDKAAVAVGYAVNAINTRFQFKVGASVNSERDVNYGFNFGYNW